MISVFYALPVVQLVVTYQKVLFFVLISNIDDPVT